MTWQLTYTAFGSRGLRSVLEKYDTLEEAQRAARRSGAKHYEIWATTQVVKK